MNKSLLFVFILFSKQIFSQAAWDIDYIKVDSISERHIGKEVRIDFRKEIGGAEEMSFRYFVSREDKGNLVIENVDLAMKEVRAIYPDWGLYREQYLESLNEVKPGLKLRVANSVLKAVNKDSILITASVEWHKVKKTKKSSLVQNGTYDIWVEKSKVNGLMVKWLKE